MCETWIDSSLREMRVSTMLQKMQDTYRRLPPSRRKVLTRAAACCILLMVFYVVVRCGGPLVIIVTLIMQMQAAKEVLDIAYLRYRIHASPDFKHISSYFIFCALLFCWCANLHVVFVHPAAALIGRHYRFVCFGLHFCGIAWFAANLHRAHSSRQFGLLAWTHTLALLVVAQSCLIVHTVYAGRIWFVVCITTVASNDIIAYVCGSLFGRTPLIALSPKKTREGFVGAAFGSVLITCLVAYIGVDKPFLICPDGGVECTPSDIYQLRTYSIMGITVQMYPMMVHTFWLALFGSLVAPFGGFFASGFKRACRVKDFAQTIPGHGGVMDRFDCQLLMITFLSVYVSTFVIPRNEPQKLLHRIGAMTDEQQMELLRLLADSLHLERV